ncbi:hypothetical protein RIR_jg21897.t1 [Rhizophagus irregularis DAOM 181602=DAOM 197198]|nr:hypothetical protein RIR_jg21897.t1 [Rhizophagus irregularis DAOM 181602=DAOM 197198]
MLQLNTNSIYRVTLENATYNCPCTKTGSGNCQRLKTKGSLVSDDISLVPLQRPSNGFKFRRRIIGTPIFNFNSPGGSSGILKDLKNSGE